MNDGSNVTTREIEIFAEDSKLCTNVHFAHVQLSAERLIKMEW